MQYDEFIAATSALSGEPPEVAESLTHATLRVLADRLSGGEAEDLASQLPKELKPDLIPPTEQAESFPPDVFVHRVAEQAHVGDEEAQRGVAAVLITTREAVTPGEWDDVASQLGRELDVLMAGAL